MAQNHGCFLQAQFSLQLSLDGGGIALLLLSEVRGLVEPLTNYWRAVK